MKDSLDLHAFPVTRRWPPRDPSVIQLYSAPTPNGVKVSVALEELGLPYEAHRLSLDPADVKSPAFTSLNPNGRIPAIIDPDGPDGRPIGLFESGAILLYLADKTGRLARRDATERWAVTQWLMFQMGGVGPMFGQVGFFVKFAGAAVTDPVPRERYLGETRRLLGVLDAHLDGRDWVAGAYSIADIAVAPWLRQIDGYGARDLVGWHDFAHVGAYLERFLGRPAVQRGLTVPART